MATCRKAFCRLDLRYVPVAPRTSVTQTGMISPQRHPHVLSPPQDVQERAGYVLAISVGLGSLFDDAEDAELAWLNTPREDLKGRSPLACMLEGRMANVIEVALLVNRERGM